MAGDIREELRLAELALYGEDWPAALQQFRELTQWAPQTGDAWAGLGFALEKLGRGSEAESAFRTALERDPGNAVALAGIGAICLSEGRFAEALEAFETALRAAPQLVDDIPGLDELVSRVRHPEACQLTGPAGRSSHRAADVTDVGGAWLAR